MPARATRDSIHQAIAQLQQLVELFQRRRAQLAGSVELTEHQWGVLEEISTEHFMPSMFARKRESSPAAVSKTLRQLSEKGLVESSIGSADGRQRHYQLTVKGKRTMSKLRQRREEAIERVWSELEPTAIDGFIVFSKELAERLSEIVDVSPAASLERSATNAEQGN